MNFQIFIINAHATLKTKKPKSNQKDGLANTLDDTGTKYGQQ